MALEAPRGVAVALLVVSSCLLWADQVLLGPNLSAAAADLGIPAAERDARLGGDVAVAYFAVGGPCAVLIGYLADRVPCRVRLYAAVVWLGELGSLLTYFVTEYWQLVLLRALTGVAVGGAAPVIHALVADLFPPERRSVVAAAVQFANVGGGPFLGQLVAGSAGPAWGWRAPFVLVALPSLAAAAAILAVVRDPGRGAAEGLGAAAPPRSDARAVAQFFSVPTNVLAFAQGLAGCVPWGIIMVFLPDYLAQDRGLGVAAAARAAAIFSVGAAAGAGGGGAVGQAVYNRRHRHLPLLMGLSTVLGMAPLLAVVGGAPAAAGGFALTAGLLLGLTGPNVHAVVLNVNAPDVRATAYAVYTLSDDLGKGLGPWLVAVLISAFGRQTAFNVGISLGFLLCGGCLLLQYFTLEDDERAVARTVEGFGVQFLEPHVRASSPKVVGDAGCWQDENACVRNKRSAAYDRTSSLCSNQ